VPAARADRGALLVSAQPLTLAVTLRDVDLERIAERAAELVAERAAPEPLLSVEQAADYLACKPKRIYDLCSQRRVPFAKDGSRTLLRRADLDAYLEAQA